MTHSTKGKLGKIQRMRERESQVERERDTEGECWPPS